MFLRTCPPTLQAEDRAESRAPGDVRGHALEAAKREEHRSTERVAPGVPPPTDPADVATVPYLSAAFTPQLVRRRFAISKSRIQGD